ncbi:hypothetical protein T310_8172 [Rasamsonia emersonii CBS 393.64]|uniref:Uncharacterized protein n=1 Tax=Rasamsonia emersonii (strain ATCC 16479 / CBS 393.64 / IMI 116815) TaxID=1408163 RepID=A0A0F4YJW2_RASE3|nr:hypothetical protein T310_8172 [Rasamsonia emersonii CBS 393.64]KKA17883.1 hypothetical protein T310_8172 [Rasamsonia emersonii CBS 393.64]
MAEWSTHPDRALPFRLRQGVPEGSVKDGSSWLEVELDGVFHHRRLRLDPFAACLASIDYVLTRHVDPGRELNPSLCQIRPGRLQLDPRQPRPLLDDPDKLHRAQRQSMSSCSPLRQVQQHRQRKGHARGARDQEDGVKAGKVLVRGGRAVGTADQGEIIRRLVLLVRARRTVTITGRSEDSLGEPLIRAEDKDKVAIVGLRRGHDRGWVMGTETGDRQLRRDGDVDVDPSVLRTSRHVHHDGDYETKEEQQRIGSHAWPRSRVPVPLEVHHAVLVPAVVEEAEMERGEQQQTPGDPAVIHIQPLIRHAGQEAHDVVFAGQQHDQGHLGHRKPSSTHTDGGIPPGTRDVVVIELRTQNKNPVRYDHEDRAQGGNLDPGRPRVGGDLQPGLSSQGSLAVPGVYGLHGWLGVFSRQLVDRKILWSRSSIKFCRKIDACVSLEKSTPAAVSGVDRSLFVLAMFVFPFNQEESYSNRIPSQGGFRRGRGQSS